MSAGERLVALGDTRRTTNATRLQASDAIGRSAGPQRSSRSNLQADHAARGFGALLWLMPLTTPRGADYFVRSRNRVDLSIFKNMSMNFAKACKASVGRALGAL